MADDKTKTGKPDRDRINVDDELQYWSDKFEVTPERLRQAVKNSGPVVISPRCSARSSEPHLFGARKGPCPPAMGWHYRVMGDLNDALVGIFRQRLAVETRLTDLESGHQHFTKRNDDDFLIAKMKALSDDRNRG